ncbi:class I SAM-dependent methyltransferase [Aurantiacibacter poecillastricola]|uniref:class I SAM-dependent methyltransferase n=1 Tax=Aurantiacibacter poecillastricola TaxID=3064385 RepID=UPI00273F5DC9|nr:hypothetical protein [Aurantiacibacter sp. 219JJ12-13]MDP5260122.1 hypothetical protein [Aurantiacibacter sp. 219JJ12-13]
MRFTPFIAAAAVAMSAPALADHHGEAPTLEEVLAMDMRAEDAARDRYRSPAETLEFFQVEPTMRVVEYNPGGGWYTRVLAPWIAPQGAYIAMQSDTGEQEPGEPSWAETFRRSMTESGISPAAEITAFESDEIPESVSGTVDRVLVFRSLHGLMNGNAADRELRAIRTLLADDGMVGVVQHRAGEDAPYSYANGSNGYLRQSDVVRLFELHGFELVDTSEVNANPDDPADWEGGVWTLPPVLRYGDEDRARYEAIGESDRMTLLFRKRD